MPFTYRVADAADYCDRRARARALRDQHGRAARRPVISFGQLPRDLALRGGYVDRMLDGAKPGELPIVPQAYFEVVAAATVAGGQFQMRHAPQERIVRRKVAQEVVEAAQDFEGALGVRVEDKRQGPPKLHDLPSLQKLCSSRFGWPASKTLEVAQELYDGQGKKIITYPRAEVRYLPESLISDVPKIVAGLQAGKSFSAIPAPDPPIIRKGASGSFHDKGLECGLLRHYHREAA
jgi:hypothetical protein